MAVLLTCIFLLQFQTDKLVEEARAKFEKLFLSHTDMVKKVQSDSSYVVFWIALRVHFIIIVLIIHITFRIRGMLLKMYLSFVLYVQCSVGRTSMMLPICKHTEVVRIKWSNGEDNSITVGSIVTV